MGGIVTLKISITIVAHSLDIRPLVRSVMGDGVMVHCFLHSDNPVVRKWCIELNYEYLHFDFCDVGTNRGLAKSWNEGLRLSQMENADVMMIANDDIEASYADVIQIAYQAHRSAHLDYMVSGIGDDLTTGEHKDMLFALCAITPLAIEKIGYFDEQFAPIYFEDLDYYRRAELLGLTRYMMHGTHIKHIGSGTRKANLAPEAEAQFWLDFEANKARYIAKWSGNGYRGSEQYTTPYNDPTKGLRIE